MNFNMALYALALGVYLVATTQPQEATNGQE